MRCRRGRWILRGPSPFCSEVARPPGYPGEEGAGRRDPIRSCLRLFKWKTERIITMPFLPSQVTGRGGWISKSSPGRQILQKLCGRVPGRERAGMFRGAEIFSLGVSECFKEAQVKCLEWEKVGCRVVGLARLSQKLLAELNPIRATCLELNIWSWCFYIIYHNLRLTWEIKWLDDNRNSYNSMRWRPPNTSPPDRGKCTQKTLSVGFQCA